MNERDYIDKVKFKLFLRRELSLFATSVTILSHTTELQKHINFGFKNICYLNDGQITNSFRTDKELAIYNKVITDLIKNNRLKCNNLLNKGIRLNNFARRLLVLKKNYVDYSDSRLNRDFYRLLDGYLKLFVFSTVIPHEIGIAFSNLKITHKIKNYANLEKKINQLRLESFYVVYEEKIFGPLFKEVAKRRKIKNYELLFNLKYNEISEFILGKMIINESELGARSTFVNLVTPKIIFTKFGEANCKKYYKLLLKPSSRNTNTISGKTAYPGKVKGCVRVLINRKDTAKFIKGEILATVSSNPEFMLAIKKAKAIIADEGGLTCHAAIISRELKIPCIIGTKVATEVLKDGDFVEVDANQGIVRVLKKV